MASAFGHAIVAFTASRFFPRILVDAKVICVGVLSSIMPDIDVLSFSYGIPYEDLWGHRGMTHSISFAVIWALIVVFVMHPRASSSDRWTLGVFYCITTMSHGILDALTTGGAGVAFFAPFDAERYFLPWQVIKVSPLSAGRFFSEWGWRVIFSEAKYIGLPCLALWSIATYRKMRSS